MWEWISLGYFVGVFLSGLAGRGKKVGYWGTVLVSFFVTPLTGLLVASLSDPKGQKPEHTELIPGKTVRCDACGTIITQEDQHLRVQADQGRIRLDYCSLECKVAMHSELLHELRRSNKTNFDPLSG